MERDNSQTERTESALAREIPTQNNPPEPPATRFIPFRFAPLGLAEQDRGHLLQES